MKKTLALIISLTTALSLTACTKNADSANNLAATTQARTEATTTTKAMSEDDLIDNKAWDELKSAGKIQTENGIFTVSITLPKDLIGKDVKEENLNVNAGKKYISAKKNEDGSVTYKMTKKQHKEMLSEIDKNIDASLKELVDDEKFSFDDITHNEDFTKFNVKLSASELNMNDSFATLTFYMAGGMHGIFSGKKADDIVVEFYDSTGKLINTAHSKDLK